MISYESDIAYVLINVENPDEYKSRTASKSVAAKIVDKIRDIRGVEEAHDIFGQYDIIAKVHGRDVYAVTDIVVNKIRTIPGVAGTVTHPVCDIKRKTARKK